MSSIKEPYVISVWEEEMIPAQDWYIQGDVITEEEYNELSKEEKQNYRPHSNLENKYIKEEIRLSVEEYKEILINNPEAAQNYEKYTVMEHFEEVQGVIIGSDDIDSVYSVINPVFKENVNGSVELTFNLYYKVFDPDILDFSSNPYVPLLTNEAKIKLKFRDRWYDLVVKNCVEDSANYMFTYTCKDFYINELNKNGFKVELDAELENNQGTVTKLGKTILKDTDWLIDEKQSDPIVETKVEPLYLGVLKYDVDTVRVSDYIPDINVSVEPYPLAQNLKAGWPVLFFYSDIAERKKEPQILAVYNPDKSIDQVEYMNPSDEEAYILDTNDDVIVNGCNYRIVSYSTPESENDLEIEYSSSALRDNIINIVNEDGLILYERARAEKVIRSQKTGYDPDMDRFVSKFYKLDEKGNPDTETEYYGYAKENILRTDLAENLLANSDNFTTTEAGWVFDGVPEKRSKNKEAGYVGQIFQKTTLKEGEIQVNSTFDESVLELNLKGKEEEGKEYYYKDTQGIYYLIKVPKGEKDENGKDILEEDYVSSVDSPNLIKAYEERTYDLYKKYQQEGSPGYAEKTDNEIDAMVKETMSKKRYSKGARVAINTGVAANRSKIEQLSPGEEYIFAVSLGKFKDGETPPKINDEIIYGVEKPDAYYQFIEIDSSGEIAYQGALNAIKEFNTELSDKNLNYYLENTTYQGLYQQTYDSTYNDLKEKYKAQYLRRSGLSNAQTKKNWESGGRISAKLFNLKDDGYYGYYEIFLNVLRGKKPDDSKEECCDDQFLKALHEELLNATDSTKGKGITENVYDALITLYPPMVQKTLDYANQKREEASFILRPAYDTMGYDQQLYPEYDKDNNVLLPQMDSFNEMLFSEFYHGIIKKWLSEEDGEAVWNYSSDSSELSELLKTIYKACYNNNNAVYETWKYSKEYLMPSVFNQKGGKFYQIHEQSWVAKSTRAAEQAVINKASKDQDFVVPFTITEIFDEDGNIKPEVEIEVENFIKLKNFIKLFSGGHYIEIKEGEREYKKELVNLVDYCDEKEQDWLSTKTETDVQHADYSKQIKNMRKQWVQEYISNYIKENPEAEFGGAWYCANLLGKFYLYGATERQVGTYTYNTDTYQLNLINEGSAGEDDKELNSEYPTSNQQANGELVWDKVTYCTGFNGAEYYATPDEKGGFVFDRIDKEIRLFDPYQDVLNATFIPEKSDEGAYVFDPFIWRYRPYRDWDSKEYRDPLTLEIDNVSGVPGDKAYHPLKLFDGHIGSWYDIPTRYNMVRKYEDPDLDKYVYLENDIAVEAEYDENSNCRVVYPKGYQCDVYEAADKGKYIKEDEYNVLERIFRVNRKEQSVISFSIPGFDDFTQIFKDGFEELADNFKKWREKFKKWLSREGKDDPLESLLNILTDPTFLVEKKGAGIANSNADSNDSGRFDEDRVSIYVYGNDGKEVAYPALDEIANSGCFVNATQSGKVTIITKNDTVTKPVTKYIKYRSYYWRHWGKQRYDCRPKICIQQTANGIKTYKPYNNIEDKKSKAYKIEPIPKNSEEKTKLLNDLKDKEAIFLKDRKTTYRQRTETDYEASKYRMKKTNSMNKNYWIEAPNGDNYLRRYKFGDGEIKLFDGHLGKWVQCYSAEKVEELGDATGNKDYLDGFYIPYDNIMIPYDERIFAATKQVSRIRTVYNDTNKNSIYVLNNNIYTTLSQYLSDAGHKENLNYSNLKVSFIDNYEYDSASFAIKPLNQTNKYLEFNLGSTPQTIDLVVKEDIFTSEVIKERWAYWIAPVTKGFSLIEDPLSKLGMVFETTETKETHRRESEIGRYVFLGMQMFKHIPYETALETIITTELTEEEQTDVIEKAIKEVYDNKLYDIETFKQKLLKNQDSLILLNAAASLCEQDMTIVADFINNEEGNPIDVNLTVTKVTSEKNIIPLFPGQAPDAADLHFTNYYIYDPDIVQHPDSAIFEYVGQDYSNLFAIAYDEQCQKIRSIKGKESNYFKLLQDCCDIFDCWMQKDIEHDPLSGQVKYYDKPIYTEILDSENEDAEPQVFVGEEAKEEATTTVAKRIHHKLFGKIIKISTDENENEEAKKEFEKYRTYKEIDGVELDEKERKLLLRLNHLNNLHFEIEYMRIPDKRFSFKRFIGEEKWNGFKYGVNLNHIKRTIDSSQFSTRIIVKQNSNEFGKDKFCTIARAEENPIKENFILDFSYYINNGLLNNSDLMGDLYSDVNTRLNYYPKLTNLNRERDDLITRQSSLSVSLDDITSKYETAVHSRDAALEEITKLTQLLTSNYDTYGQVISIPWKFNKSQEYTQKRQTSTPGSKKIITDIYGEEEYTFEIEIPEITSVMEYPKYNDTMRSYFDQMDTYQLEYTNSVNLINQLGPQKEQIEAELAEIQAYLEEIANKKNELHKLFYHKYSRYIQEGSWVDEEYIDDNLYYLDALSVSRISSKPKVTYNIGVVDIAAAYEYEEDRALLESNLGDRTYIEDVEFFGYQKDNSGKPYWEKVVVVEKTYNITDPSQNKIQVKNYTTQFDDLFQRVAATSQTLQFNEGSYGRASQLMNENGTLKSEVLKESIANSDFIIANAINEDVKMDKTGITITSTMNRANIVKLVSSGILVSSDGGNHYATAITGDGINADLLLAGTINTDKLLIGGRTNPNFMWNKLGISSFKTDGNKIDYSSFVRMDQYGIYGIKNYSKNNRAPENMSINDSFEPLSLKDITENSNAVFGLTWEGFFLNAANGQGKVTIGTGQDFRMSEYSDDQSRWIDRVVIGRLNSEDRYGFQLKNSSDQVVMETDDTGELYLKRKLRISNFREEDTYEPCGWVYEGEEIQVNLDFSDEQLSDLWNDGLKQKEENGVVIYYFTDYFYKYENNIIDNNGYKQEQNLINYYTIKNNILFATKETPINWKNNIKKQLDRVSLGIVDTYSRSNNFDKVNVDGVYSSSEYLTKVFSIKSNATLPTEQFAEENINNLIEENENFALFDNGNLYAKNAWIEGNINATSGEISGDLIVSGSLHHKKEKWKINSDGSAYFGDVIISGKIQTATFEYNNIQTVSGSLMIVSGILVQNIEYSQDGKMAILELDTKVLPEDLYDGNTIKQQVKIILAKDFSISYDENKTMSNGFIITTEEVGIKKGQDDEIVAAYIVVNIENDKISKSEIEASKMVIFMEDDQSEKISIVINSSSTNGVFPKKSISILDICNINDTPRALLGFIDETIFKNEGDIDQTIINSIGNDYGLYCDNAYIKGSLINHTKDYIVGITTEDILSVTLPSKEEEESAVIFAGGNINNLNFYVTKNGNLYAKDGYFIDGYFTGTIETSKIIGNGNNYALEILGDKQNQKALRFASSENADAIEYLTLTTKGCYFYKDNKNELNEIQLFSILYDNENGIGMFYHQNEKNTKEDISAYKLNFKENSENEIVISYEATEVATVNREGIHFKNDNEIGDFCECETIIIDNQKIGVDFILR